MITVSRVAREAAHHAEDRHGEGIAWNNLGVALRVAGRVEEAIHALTRARDLHQATENLHREATARINLGNALREAGRVQEAIEVHGRALEILRKFKDWYETAQALHNLALDHEHAHRPTKARAHWLQAADAYTRANTPDRAAQARTRAETLE